MLDKGLCRQNRRVNVKQNEAGLRKLNYTGSGLSLFRMPVRYLLPKLNLILRLCYVPMTAWDRAIRAERK